MSKRFFTNEGENTLLKKFAGVFAHNPDIERFDALVGYLRASGYFALRPHLEKVPLIRIIVGIDVDNELARHHRKGLLMLGDADKTLAFVRAKLAEDVQDAPYRREIEEGIRQFVADVASKRVEIRAHSTKKLHAKLYIFLPKGFCEHKPGAVITGSSNLTAAGLGVEDSATNYEFNVVLHDFDEVVFAKNEFEKLWTEGVSVLPEAVKGVVRESYLREDLTPFELYIKFLIEYFGPAIDYDPNSERDLPKGRKALSYQGDAVNDGWLKLQKHGGFFLADVVGLGKTVVATRIAKKFYYHNGFPNHRSRILIITPPALRENWEAEMEMFGLDDAVKIINNGSLHKIRDPEKYDLIIIDEAHKFRNDTADGYDLLQKLCKTRTKHRLPDDEFAKKKVILISATPLNNRPADIRNQVLLFQDGKDSTVIGNLQHFFAQRIKEYQVATNPVKTPDRQVAHAAVARIYELIREQVVQPLTVRRTRTDLVEDKRWKADLDAQGIIFPKVEKPTPILYQLDDGLGELYDRTIQLLALLRVLRDHFKDWQVLLLTHDRAWYEIAKQQLEGWAHHELFTIRVGDYEQPILREDQDHLYWALQFLQDGHVKAAAVHVRTKFELILKWACESLGLPVKYRQEAHKIPASDFWAALKSASIKISPAPCFHRLPDGTVKWWQPKQIGQRVVPLPLDRKIEHAISWVLNPLSHSQTVDRYSKEIDEAIFALDELEDVVRKAISFQSAGPVMLREMLLTMLQQRANHGPLQNQNRHRHQ